MVRIAIFSAVIGAVLAPFFAFAFEATSTSFKLIDPVFTITGGFATSTSYQLNQATVQPALGTSTLTSFQINPGFLYFPFVTKPTVTATAGDNSVALTWSTLRGVLGWTVSGYNVGQSVNPGGPYTYTSLGNITSSTRTGLSGGTKYYFVVRPEDAFGNSIATSTEVSATPTTPAPSPSPSPAPSPAPAGGGGGGGGGGGILTTPQAETKSILKGKAYPDADLTIFKDGVIVATPHLDSTGLFTVEMSVEGGLYSISLYAVDSQNRRSLTQSFTITVPKNVTVTIPDIVIAPSISADKSEVKQGNDIIFSGSAYPQSQVRVVVNSENQRIDKTTSDKRGVWSYTLNSGTLEMGGHVTKSQVMTPDGLQSPYSESVAFQVGDQDVAFSALPVAQKPAPEACSKNGDINKDGKVNIIDFSILLFFWNQRTPKNLCADINKDGIVNLFDFSIMLFWWTG